MLALILVCLASALSTNAYPLRSLFDGDSCEMEDQIEGVCVPIFNCPMRIHEVQSGIRVSTTERGRCSFDGHVEIVCCYQWDVTADSRSSTQRPYSTTSTTTLRTTQSPFEKTTTTFRPTTGSSWTPQSLFPKITTTTTTTTMETISVDENDDRGGYDSIRPAEEACYENQKRRDDEKTITCNIIGGEKAKAGEFPFIAALGYVDKESEKNKLKYICGGSLITTRHILTAAHCVINIQGNEPIEVKLGAVSLNRASNKETEMQNSVCLNKTLSLEQNIPIAAIKVHPQYRGSQKYHDIAVITLAIDAKITKNVKPICLQYEPLSNLAVLVNTSRVVAGWGVTDLSESLSDQLLKTPSLQLIDRSTCDAIYKETELASKLPKGIDDSMICMRDGDTTRYSDACQGDSGGPLVQKNNLLTPSLIGVVSFGSSCGNRIPGVYTNVYHYLDWIEEVVWPEKKLASNRILTSESPYIDIRFQDDY